MKQAPNSIDLRGIEQSVSLKDAETYAATMGYDFLYFGYHEGARDVDPALKSNIVHEHFWTHHEHAVYFQSNHVPSFPGRKHCAHCGEKVFNKKGPQKFCTQPIAHDIGE